MLHNNYRPRNLIGHYHVWVKSPRNSTSFTRLFLTGKRARVGHETRKDKGGRGWSEGRMKEGGGGGRGWSEGRMEEGRVEEGKVKMHE